MRVVGGKTGADGKLFAHIVWTVSGGPAEKGGLQQGDKILEWCGVSLVDRSFEEVCAIMDRTGDIAELLVEQATDFRMCDLLEDGGNQGNQGGGGLNNPMITINQRKTSDVGLIAGKFYLEFILMFLIQKYKIYLIIFEYIFRSRCISGQITSFTNEKKTSKNTGISFDIIYSNFIDV